ncbi:MAG: cytochrome b [Alphaproteobacteria bacterium]
MALKSTTTHYGSVAIAIHWLTAILIIVMLASGLRVAGLEDSASKLPVLSVHVPLGTLILLLTLGRIAWWWWGDRKPAPVEGSPLWQERAARAVHILFYIVILSMAGSGLAMVLLSGAGAILRGGEGQLPDFWDYTPRGPHLVFSRILIGLFVLHVAAALHHHFIRRDGLIARMWFSRRP